MTLNVRLFGPLADAAGSQVLRLDAPGASSLAAAEVMKQIAQSCPKLRPMLSASRLAVNSAFAAPDHPVTERDELALIGMVSGG